jgi:hypothetical protein
MLLFLNTLLFAWFAPLIAQWQKPPMSVFPGCEVIWPFARDDDDGTRVVRVDVDAHM